MIRNPVLPGFHPDPCILRVGDDYWIATSTFEWFPGVRLHHSRDLVHWRPVGYALTRRSQLDLRGNARSGGVWAPALSYAHGRFHLVYTDVKQWSPSFIDSHNYLVTAEHVEGPWGDPVYLNSSGFDPSWFTDDDGSQWLLNMVWDPRPGADRFWGIVIQAYDRDAQRLVGDPQRIWGGTLGLVEGPHLFKHQGWYYLLCAEGGTGYEHALTVARSRDRAGPYEPHPDGPLVTSRGRPDLALQKAGHGNLVQTQAGDWYVTHLCGRPVGPDRRCILGRETAIQAVTWGNDGWPRLAHGDACPRVEVPAPDLPPHPWAPRPARDDFDADTLGPDWQTLRVPPDASWLSLTERLGWLRLRGRESPRSLHAQSLVGQRVTHLSSRFETRLDVAPTTFQQMAGLLAFYDDEQFYYLLVTHTEGVGRHLALLQCLAGEVTWVSDTVVPLPEEAPVRLAVTFSGATLRFSYELADDGWSDLGPDLDATALSDEATTRGLGFTGAFVALACHDVSGRRCVADFDYFTVESPDD